MAKKGLIVTLGEMGHKRFNRLDFVGTRYGIKSVEDFTIDRIIDSIKLIGKRNKKTLTPLYVKEWRNIGRVWFAIDGEYKNPVKPRLTKATEEEGQLSIFDFLSRKD